MNRVIRNILAVAAGVVLGGLTNMALVTLGPQVISPPAGVDMSDAKSLSASSHLLEPKHFVFPFLAHAFGTLVGALTAYLVAGSWRAVFSYGIGVFFLAGGIAASFLIAAPPWFVALDLLVAYLPMAWLGMRIGRRVRPETRATKPRVVAASS